MTTKENLLKELRKLQRDLNSSRLQTYREGDNSEEAMALKKEREVKLARFNEVLKTLNEMDNKYANGSIVKGDKINVLKDAIKHKTNSNRSDVEERYNNSDAYDYREFCDKCGRGIKGNPAFYIHMVAPDYVVPNDEQNNAEIDRLSIKGDIEDMGYYPIGSECVKSYPKKYWFDVSKLANGGGVGLVPLTHEDFVKLAKEKGYTNKEEAAKAMGYRYNGEMWIDKRNEAYKKPKFGIDETVIVYAENKEGHRKIISEHKSVNSAKNKIKNISNEVFNDSNIESIGTMDKIEFEKYYKDFTFANGGEVNGRYLDNISDSKKNKILNNIANHYAISIDDAEQEVKDSDAEMLYEYIANDASLRMDVYNDFKGNKFDNGGGINDDDDVKDSNYMKFVVKNSETQKEFENYLQELSNKYFKDYYEQLEEDGYDFDDLFNSSVFQDNLEYVTSFTVPFDDDIVNEIADSIEKKFGDSVKIVPYYYKSGGNVGRDRLFKSKQPHEQNYKRKTEWKEYKKEGWFGDWFANGGGVGDFSEEEILSIQEKVERGGQKVAISKEEINNEDGGLSYGINFEQDTMWYGDDKELRDSDYDALSQLLTFNSSKYSYDKYSNGGGVYNENAEMVINNNKQIRHHTEELSNIVSPETKVPAWVVAKVNRSASDLSDATHYLEGAKGKEYANGGGVGLMAGGGAIKQNEGKLFNEKGEMLVYKKQSDTSSIYDVDVYEPRKTDVEEYSKFKYCKREKNGRECVYRLDKKALLEMIKKEKFIYSNGGGVGNQDLSYASKTFSKSSEDLVKDNLFNGEISSITLQQIIGHEPNYPCQIVGSLKLTKCFLRPYYKI